MKLLGDKSKPCTLKVQVAAEMAGIPLPLAPATSSKCHYCQPSLETLQGTISGCNSCLRYIARIRPEKSLYGQTPYDAAQVDSWLDFCWMHIDMPLECPAHKKEITDTLKTLDDQLQTETYMVGQSITIADLCIATALSGNVSAETLSGMPHLSRWLKTILNQKGVKKVMSGDSKPAAAAKKDKAAQKPTASSAADEDIEQPPKPAKSPLDDLPPSSFDLDAWKRMYSNTKDLSGEAMKYFWENYDAAGWSLWHMKYDKLEDECTVSYVTSNQLGGFIQRTDPNFRKYAFGNCNVIGNDKDFNITGVWLFRGLEMPPQMKDHPSYEYHTWRKLNHTNEADKKLIADYWCAEDSVEGHPIVDSKVYK